MRISIKKGFSFGLTSGVITTLGLIVGLNSGTHSPVVVISGIMVIAIADAMSDALGIHISEEAENRHSVKEIWESTITTFLSKFLFALTFVVPFLLLPIYSAIMVCVAYGLSLLIIMSYYLARQQNIRPAGVISEHLIIAVIVIAATHYIGQWIGGWGRV